MEGRPIASEAQVRVVPYDPRWPGMFEMEAVAIGAALGETVIAIHHIGSTAIAGILAKPIIDLLVEAQDLDRVDERSAAMERVGYEAMGEFGIAGRRYFTKNGATGARSHHVHIFESGTPQIERHLAFRNYLRANPDVAHSYSELKARLTGSNGCGSGAYVSGKADFLERTVDEALAWHRTKR